MASKSIAEHMDVALGKNYRFYVLFVLFVVYIFNFIDRQILTILVEPIKREFGVSDTAMGFLTGTAFALFYATLGMPIARLADRRSRRSIIAIALTLWSGMTALCGTATAFMQLAIFRVGVAVGEAGASPPSHSVLADYFRRHERARALAFYSMGIPLGGTLGVIIGGWVSEIWGWRMAFLVVGLPGVALALLVRLTIREPRRGESEEDENGDAVRVEEIIAPEPPPVRRVLDVLWTQKSFMHMALATALHAFVGYGLAAFNPAYVERIYEVSRTELAVKLGLVAGITGAAGVMLGGWLGDKLAVYDRRWYMWLPALAMISSVPFYIGLYTVNDFDLFLILLVIPSFMGNLYAGPAFATTQALVPLAMRALAAAVLLFIINIIGLGLGPQAVGVLSDLLSVYQFDGDDGQSLRYALLCVALVKVWAATHYVLAGRTLRADLDRVAGIQAAFDAEQKAAQAAKTAKT